MERAYEEWPDEILGCWVPYLPGKAGVPGALTTGWDDQHHEVNEHLKKLEGSISWNVYFHENRCKIQPMHFTLVTHTDRECALCLAQTVSSLSFALQVLVI